MVDAQAVNHALCIKPQYKLMHGVKNGILLHAYAYQFADFKKPTPIDGMGCIAPPSQLIVLFGKQIVQALPPSAFEGLCAAMQACSFVGSAAAEEPLLASPKPAKLSGDSGYGWPCTPTCSPSCSLC